MFSVLSMFWKWCKIDRALRSFLYYLVVKKVKEKCGGRCVWYRSCDLDIGLKLFTK